MPIKNKIFFKFYEGLLSNFKFVVIL